MDPRVERMADVLVNYCVSVKPGQWVVMNTGTPAEPMAVACQRAILRAGAYPNVYVYPYFMYGSRSPNQARPPVRKQ